MRFKFPIFILSTLLILSCNKSKFNGAPVLSMESVSTSVLSVNSILTFTISLTDGPGNVSGAKLYVWKVVPDCTGSQFYDSLYLPSFPEGKDLKADVTVSYANGLYVTDSHGNSYPSLVTPQCNQNDTCYFRFLLKDNAGHLSDTLNSQKIVILYQ